MATSSGVHTVQQLIARAKSHLQTCQQLTNINGVHKLRRKIQAELDFLNKFQAENGAEAELKCSNLPWLTGVVEHLLSLDNPTETMKPVKSTRGSGNKSSLQVDIVSGNGKEWHKIIARNADALMRDWKGRGEFKRRTLMSQSNDYISAAKENPVQFQTPKIHFVFLFGVHHSMANRLESLGISVVGNRIKKSDDESFDSDDDGGNFEYDSSGSDDADYGSCVSAENVSNRETIDNDELGLINQSQESLTRVNLDITACIALISNVTHGGANFIFTDDILTEQSAQERIQPALPELENFLKGKELFMCKTAHDDLMKIVDTVAGSTERRRLNELMQNVEIVDDLISERSEKLEIGGKVKQRSKVIFGCGDRLKAVTVTANSGFVRAAHGQGLDYVVFIHPARALTEQKESTATPL